MQSVFCQEWCEEVRQEVSKLIAHYIDDEIKAISPGSYFTIAESKNEARDQFVFQFYYNEDIRTVFLHYEMDKLLRYNYDPIDICKRINKRLQNNFQRETKRRIKIMGPYVPGSVYKNLCDSETNSSVIVKMTTFSYWKCVDGIYRFINDSSIQELLQANLNTGKIVSLAENIMRINRKYNFTQYDNEETVSAAFEDLSKTYLAITGKELKPVTDDMIITTYLDPFYPEIEAKMK